MGNRFRISLEKSEQAEKFQRLFCWFFFATGSFLRDCIARSSPTVDLQDTSREAAKRALLEAIDGTGRGSGATLEQRGSIAENQLAVEAFGGNIDVDELAGTWRLLYTSAPDVLPILQLQNSGFVQVGDIYQAFTSEGQVENIVKFAVPFLLQESGAEGNGGCLRVAASYNIRGPKTIALVFEEAKVGELRISELIETLLAPAVLPRMFGASCPRTFQCQYCC
ncbi:hypothetical protein CYMTET_24704 [Cymbomonas tetramitiformis]|uniref:Plastid lipid-associated protein/fibrillin conserved domain-containing protein n=1 Tax=Cymbomonas tetramitiformis TaxID=36881 RepID=A0AAE0FVJ0_9CHLO|nr:hypothetical protein CYMTET_24704 [Cymbomonas tetramitiformis]